MKEYRNLDLIDGVFIPEAAKDVIFELIKSKIEFHSSRGFSGDIIYSERRVKELKDLKDIIGKIVRKAVNDGKKMKIRSSIEIELID